MRTIKLPCFIVLPFAVVQSNVIRKGGLYILILVPSEGD